MGNKQKPSTPLYPKVIVSIPANIPDIFRFTANLIKIAKRAAVPVSRRHTLLGELMHCDDYNSFVMVVGRWFTIKSEK